MNIADGRFFQGKFGGDQQKSNLKHTENFSKTVGEMAAVALTFLAATVLCIKNGGELFFPLKNNKNNNIKKK